MAQTAGLLSLLAEFGMQRFHVEYRVYRSNHLLHALVALHGLGARDGRLEEIAKHMATDYPLEPARASEGDLQGDEWKLLLGKKKRFVDLRKFFTAKVDSLGAGSAIAEYYTPLLDGGVACAALHPLIHLGYGLLANSSQDVADGLAYVVWAHRAAGHNDGIVSTEARDKIVLTVASADSPLPSWAGAVANAPKPTHEFLAHPLCSILLGMRRDIRLQRTIPALVELVDENLEKLTPLTGYGKYSLRLFHIQDSILDIVEGHLDDSGVLGSVTSDESLEQVLSTLMQGILLAYASTANSDDFFILHGLTSIFALQQVLPCLPSFAARLEAVRVFCRDLLSVYILQDMPSLVPWSVDHADLPSWDEIRTHTVKSNDEHLIKVVFTCQRMEQQFGKELLGAEVYRAVAAYKSGLRQC